MQETGILADERTIIIRENFFKSNDWISEMMKMSPQPDWVPEQIALIEEQRKWLEENDPLFSNNELIAWLNKTSSSDYIIDPELIASILETLGVGTTEIVSETPVIVESNESGNGWTNPTDSNEIVIPNDEDNTPARVGQVKYDGYLTNIYGMRMEPFWFDIDFTSGTFSGLWIFHGEGPIVAWEIDENGIRIPGSEYQLSVKFESIGEVSGKIDSSNNMKGEYGERCNWATMEVDDDGNTNGVVIRPGAGDNVILGNILGTLFENNYASGTIAGTNMSTSFAWEVWEVDHHSGMGPDAPSES